MDKLMRPFFERALPYIERNIPVFPTRPDKRPLTTHGKNDATCESLTVEEWSERWPEANVSLPTGEASGLVVLDIDGDEGEASLARIASGWRVLPKTAEARSGRGRHLYYSWLPIKCSAGKLAPGIDIRGDGGSITAPISRHQSGKLYEWVVPLGDHQPLFPLWIIRSLAPKPYIPRPHDGPADIDRWLNEVRSCPLGSRNHTLNRAAFIVGLMVRDGKANESEAFNRLVNAGMLAGLDKREAQSAVRSGLRSAMRSK